MVSKWWALSIQSAWAEHVLTQNAGQCSPFPWDNTVMWHGITARYFNESVAGVIQYRITVEVTVKTPIDTSVNAMQRTQKQRQHRLWLVVFDLGCQGSLLAVGELRFLRLPWLLLWKKVQRCVILRALTKETALQYPTWLFTYFLFTVIFLQGNESAV